jgi:hypothetical protein
MTLLLLVVGLSANLSLSIQRGQRPGAGIPEGQPAVDFDLKLLKSDKTFKLSSNFGKQPTVLIFGSYT